MERAQADAAGRIASSEEPSPAEARNRQGRRLLIAEDDRTLREGLRLALEGDGYVVHAVSTGQEALDAIAGSRFDIVITDLHLTPVTGLDVVRAATRASSPAAVIVMTGDASLDNSLTAIRAGACDCLAKPFSASRLCSMLARVARLEALPAGTGATDTLVEEFERLYVHRLVQDAAGNLERAARMARVDRRTLDSLIEKHDVAPPP